MSAAALLELAVKSSVVLLLAWIATWGMDRASAATRHFVWAVALSATLILPAVVLFGPAWHVARFPSTWTLRDAGASNASSRAAGPRADGEVWPAITSPSSHAPVSDTPGLSRSLSRPGRRFLRSSANVWRENWPAFLVWAWAAGATLGVVNLLAGLLWATWFTRRAAALTTPAWIASHAEATALMEVTGSVPLLVSEWVGVPVACGVARPALVLPPDAESWDPERRRIVLLHELAHVKRRDCLIQVVAHLAWAIHWFNPLAFLAVSRLRSEQERACDDLVLTVGTAATTYASHLCDIAHHARRVIAPAWATLAIARRSRLESRVAAILDAARSRRAPSGRRCAAVAGLACLAVFALGALRPAAVAQAMAILPSAALNAIAPYSPLVPPPQPRSVKADIEAVPETSVPAEPIRRRPVIQELNADTGRAFLESCTACHNSRLNVARLALDTLNLQRVGDKPEIWEKVVRKLRSGLHPPAGVVRPGRVDADAFCASIEGALDRADQANWMPAVAERLGDREIAGRLAKFLWNAEPDDALSRLAASGALRDPATLQQQVRRMIADRRSAALLTGFFGGWLHLENLATVKPDPTLFPEFDDNLRQAFKRETELFLASQVRDDHSITELLSANYTFLNERLARHYGIASVTGPQFRRVTLADSTRAGLLGHASILSVTSLATRTSPVVRGKWLTDTWLGSPPPPPPPNVPALRNADPDHPATLRARMEQHHNNAVCAACHSSMDPLGLAFENFDALGRWRTSDDGLPIDASGTLPDGSRFDGPSQLRALLLDRRVVIVNTITLKLLAYALGRPAQYADMPAVRAIAWDAAPDNYKWSSIIVGVVRSAPFQMKRID